MSSFLFDLVYFWLLFIFWYFNWQWLRNFRDNAAFAVKCGTHLFSGKYKFRKTIRWTAATLTRIRIVVCRPPEFAINIEVLKLTNPNYRGSDTALNAAHLHSMKELSTIPNRRSFTGELAIWLIKNVWQNRLSKTYSRKMKAACRFHPSCSEYSAQSFKKYSFLIALRKTANRIKRCNLDNTDSCVDFP